MRCRRRYGVAADKMAPVTKPPLLSSCDVRRFQLLSAPWSGSSCSSPTRSAYKGSTTASSVSTTARRTSLIPIDLDEFLYRLMGQEPQGSGLDEWFQQAFTMTALDRRPFAPPLESAPDRVVNMRGACEKYGVAVETIEKLQKAGFRSVSLLALASRERLISLRLQRQDRAPLDNLIHGLNASPLEPLYSLKKYFSQKKRNIEKKLLKEGEKNAKVESIYGWLDLEYKVSRESKSGRSSSESSESSSSSGPAAAPQKRPSTNSSTLKYLAVTTFRPEDAAKPGRGAPHLLKRPQNQRSDTPYVKQKSPPLRSSMYNSHVAPRQRWSPPPLMQQRVHYRGRMDSQVARHSHDNGKDPQTYLFAST